MGRCKSIRDLGLNPITANQVSRYYGRETQNTTIMNSLHKPTLLSLAFVLACLFGFAGCNTMKGLGKDTERAGEKIQDKASR